MRPRSAASSARTCARRSTGCRRAGGCSPSRPTARCRWRPTDLAHRRAPMPTRLQALYERFEFKSWLRDLAGGDAARRTPPARSRARRRATTAQRSPPHDAAVADGAAAGAAPLRDRASTRRALRALARRDRAARSSSRFDTETTSLDPMAARHRRPVVRRRARAAPATSRSRTATRARRTSSPPDAVLARLAPWFADPARAEARPERQVRPARARQPRHRARAASRTTRCSSPTCSNRTSRTTWTASPWRASRA